MFETIIKEIWQHFQGFIINIIGSIPPIPMTPSIKTSEYILVWGYDGKMALFFLANRVAQPAEAHTKASRGQVKEPAAYMLHAVSLQIIYMYGQTRLVG